MDTESQNANQADLAGNILLDNEQTQGISSAQFQKPATQQKTSTLDEPVSETIKRDLRMIGVKLKFVLLPKTKEEGVKELRNWICGGHFSCVSALQCNITLSLSTSSQAETVFTIIFVVIWVGAGIVTLNAKLLGGKISFFQSVCVLGYCIFPINIASFISLFLPKEYTIIFIIKTIICGFTFFWSTRASVPFMSTLVSEEKKFLASYPVFLFYLFLSWITLVA